MFHLEDTRIIRDLLESHLGDIKIYTNDTYVVIMCLDFTFQLNHYFNSATSCHHSISFTLFFLSKHKSFLDKNRTQITNSG